MRSFVAMLFAGWMLIGSLLPSIGIDQSAHLGDLVQHYQQHHREDPEMTLLDFLMMHYGANSEHLKHPRHSHQNLPTSGHSLPVYAPNVVQLAIPVPYDILMSSKVEFFRLADMYSFLSVFVLIDPPRA